MYFNIKWTPKKWTKTVRIRRLRLKNIGMYRYISHVYLTLLTGNRKLNFLPGIHVKLPDLIHLMQDGNHYQWKIFYYIQATARKICRVSWTERYYLPLPTQTSIQILARSSQSLPQLFQLISCKNPTWAENWFFFLQNFDDIRVDSESALSSK